MNNENRIVESTATAQQRNTMDHRAITVLLCFGLSVACLLLASLAALTSPKIAFIALFVLIGIAVVLWLLHGAHHHRHEILDIVLLRELARKALEDQHSIEINMVTRTLRTISPLTIPNGPITLKDINLGGDREVQALPVTQPRLDEFYDAIRPNSLQTGLGRISTSGELAIAGILESVHFKLIGGSGFGKSCLAGSMLDIATTCNSPDVLRIALLDLEHRTSKLFEHLDHVYEVRDHGRTVRMIGRDADEVASRIGTLKQELNRRAASLIDTPVLLIYVEEMLSLGYEVDPHLQKQMLADLNILALRGKKYGMFFLACMQADYSTKELREAKGMFRTRGGFAIDPPTARASGFVNNELIKENYVTGKIGQFVLERPAFQGMVLAPRYNLDHLLAASMTTKKSSQTYDQTYDQTEPIEAPTTAPVEPLVVESRPALSVREMRVLDLLRQKRGQNEIIRELWKVGSRDGRPYQNAVTEYRKIVAHIVAESER